jgi:hypothetical protein
MLGTKLSLRGFLVQSLVTSAYKLRPSSPLNIELWECGEHETFPVVCNQGRCVSLLYQSLEIMESVLSPSRRWILPTLLAKWTVTREVNTEHA